jgi:hypothetical protein
MRKASVTLPLLVTAASWCAPSSVGAQASDPRAFLRNVLHLKEDQIASLDRGDVVTRTLDTTDPVEVAALGVLKTAGTPDQLLQLSRDVKRSRQGAHTSQIGRFSNPPNLEDLDSLQPPPDDVKALRKCKPGSCDVKMGSKAMSELATIDWTKADADARAVGVMKRMMIEFLVAYQAGGTDSLGVVVDKSNKSRTEEYQELLGNSPYLVKYVKAFHDYLVAYPKATLPETEDIFYWTKESFGIKPVISLYHLTLHREEDGVVIANKLLGASHYFNASLEILAGIPTEDGKGLYVFSLRRARIDPPTGALAGMMMGKVRSGLEGGVRENLELLRARLAEKRP